MSIRKLPSGKYQVDVCRVDPVTGNETRVRRNARTLKLAEQIERDLQDAIKAGTFGQEVPQAPTLSEFFKIYLETYAEVRNRPSTVAARRDQWARIEPVLGKVPVDRIGKAEIATLTARLRKQHSVGTVNTTLALLGVMLSHAEDLDIIHRAPRVRRLPTGKRHPDYLTLDQMRSLLDGLSDRWRVAAIVCATTGMRPSEVCALHWSSVVYDRMVIEVRHAISHGVMVDLPKGGAQRTVPMTEWCAQVLRAWPQRLGSPLVFPGDKRSRSGAMSRGALRGAIRDAAIAVIGRCATPRTLRHTYATHLAALGTDMRVVQKILGHASVRTTEVYTHATTEAAALEAAGRLDAAIGNVTGASLVSGATNPAARQRNETK